MLVLGFCSVLKLTFLSEVRFFDAFTTLGGTDLSHHNIYQALLYSFEIVEAD